MFHITFRRIHLAIAVNMSNDASLHKDEPKQTSQEMEQTEDTAKSTEMAGDSLESSQDAEIDSDEAEDESSLIAEDASGRTVRVRRKKRQLKSDAAELRLQGRHELCKRIADIAPLMFKIVKQRVLSSYLESQRGMEDDDLIEVLKKDAGKLSDRVRVIKILSTPDEEFDRGQIQAVIFGILIQEETHSIDENRLYEKVNDFEKDLVKRAKNLDFDDLKKQDADRWHHFDTYKIVLDAAWSDDEMISPDEARLLSVLRSHLSISMEEHWLISAHLKRFPKAKCVLHSPDEINEARKEMQRRGVLWSYKDDTNRNIDVIPYEIASIIRQDHFRQELQRTNYRRLMNHDGIMLSEIKDVLIKHSLNRYGNKAELIERVVVSDILPSEVLEYLDKEKLSLICSGFGLKAYGAKNDLIEAIIRFYDDLTFEERTTKDEREVWFNNYELLASRSYAELRAKKVISKDLDIEHLFEDATAFLFEERLNVTCDCSRKENRADGRLPLENNQSILWDCKSVEGLVNLQDHLENQFDGYLRKERESGKQALAFLVIGPAFTPQSIKLASQYKAKTNWDIALLTAEGLKHLAERWFATEPNKPFPVQLLNRTDVIDKERAEFLLSLA